MIQTEVEFTLPKGFAGEDGTLHREGVMRLATAADEILPLREASVQKNPAYLTVILLSRVVTRLGALELVTPATIERMFAADVAYLQELYNEINNVTGQTYGATCPQCDCHFEVEKPISGGIVGHPLDAIFEEVAYIAYHFNWSVDTIMDLEHSDRHRFIDEISRLNERANDEGPRV